MKKLMYIIPLLILFSCTGGKELPSNNSIFSTDETSSISQIEHSSNEIEISDINTSSENIETDSDELLSSFSSIISSNNDGIHIEEDTFIGGSIIGA